MDHWKQGFLAAFTALTVSFSWVLFLPETSEASETTDWAVETDIPKAEPVSVGLAGSLPADITRFLLARGVYGVHISPTGDHIAYISRVTGRPQVWLMPASGGQPWQLTFGGGVTFYKWHPDGGHILYGADNNGDEREAFYLIDTRGQSEKIIAPASDA